MKKKEKQSGDFSILLGMIYLDSVADMCCITSERWLIYCSIRMKWHTRHALDRSNTDDLNDGMTISCPKVREKKICVCLYATLNSLKKKISGYCVCICNNNKNRTLYQLNCRNCKLFVKHHEHMTDGVVYAFCSDIKITTRTFFAPRI